MPPNYHSIDIELSYSAVAPTNQLYSTLAFGSKRKISSTSTSNPIDQLNRQVKRLRISEEPARQEVTTSSPAATSKSPSSFSSSGAPTLLTLPTELRQLIFTRVLDTIPPLRVSTITFLRPPRPPPGPFLHAN